MAWDPALYERYLNERSRPFFDLLDRIPDGAPAYVVDLGCGTGALTRALAERWPDAEVVGVDSSSEMLERARSFRSDGIEFIQQDIADWTPERPVDVLLSNAALQWLPDHDRLFPRLAGCLAPGGTLAVQMPDRFMLDSPSQRAIEAASADQRWANALTGVGLRRDSVLPAERYIDLLRHAGCEVDAWTTIYYHLLRGENPVYEWLKGTAIGALLAALDEDQREAFSSDVAARLRAEFPPHDDVTIFPVRRLFLVARRESAGTS